MKKVFNDLVKDFDPTEHLPAKIQIRMENDRLIVTKLPVKPFLPAAKP